MESGCHHLSGDLARRPWTTTAASLEPERNPLLQEPPG